MSTRRRRADRRPPNLALVIVLDVELVHLGADGKPDFAAISRRLVGRGGRAAPAQPAATFIAFDLLHVDGHATRALPYAARRRLLHDVLEDGPL